MLNQLDGATVQNFENRPPNLNFILPFWIAIYFPLNNVTPDYNILIFTRVQQFVMIHQTNMMLSKVVGISWWSGRVAFDPEVRGSTPVCLVMFRPQS